MPNVTYEIFLSAFLSTSFWKPYIIVDRAPMTADNQIKKSEGVFSEIINRHYGKNQPITQGIPIASNFRIDFVLFSTVIIRMH